VDTEEFEAWLHQELGADRIDASQVDDLLQQRRLFDESRMVIESEYLGQVIGFVADHLEVAESASELLNRAEEIYPGRMLYFESVGYRLF